MGISFGFFSILFPAPPSSFRARQWLRSWPPSAAFFLLPLQPLWLSPLQRVLSYRYTVKQTGGLLPSVSGFMNNASWKSLCMKNSVTQLLPNMTLYCASISVTKNKVLLDLPDEVQSRATSPSTGIAWPLPQTIEFVSDAGCISHPKIVSAKCPVTQL
jgi:hypothetical protein